MICPRKTRKGTKRKSVGPAVMRLIVGVDILLLTLEIGLNIQRVFMLYDAPATPCEEFGGE
jgi:hypothetical protein